MGIFTLASWALTGILLFVQDGGKRPSQGHGPEAGKPAPDFKLKRLPATDEERKKPEVVQLSSYRGKRPVVLIFGSYT